MPYGQAYHTKSNSLKIFDPHFGSAGCLNGLSSLLVGRTIAAQLRRSILLIVLLGKWAGRKFIAVCMVWTPIVFTLLLWGSWAFWRQVLRSIPLCKVSTVMPFWDLTHMMKQYKLVAHHHSHPLLCFRFQALDISVHSLLVRDMSLHSSKCCLNKAVYFSMEVYCTQVSNKSPAHY